jgi:ribosomal protein S14
MEMLWFILAFWPLWILAGLCIAGHYLTLEPDDPMEMADLWGREHRPDSSTYRAKMTCMDCGAATGSQLWKREDAGAASYAEDNEHTCHVCGHHMVNRLGEIAPEY